LDRCQRRLADDDPNLFDGHIEDKFWLFRNSGAKREPHQEQVTTLSGNVTWDSIHTYAWNSYNKLGSVDSTACATNGECVTYDAFGRIVETSYNGAYTESWYTQSGKVYMHGSTPDHAYWQSPGNGTAQINQNAVTFYYTHKDWLGNARINSVIVNPYVVSDQAYAPYGEVYNKVIANIGVPAQMFTGLTQDILGGVFDTPNRELNASQGRWLSPDPAHSGWNQYAYATNPLSLVDPLGLCDETDDSDCGDNSHGACCDSGGGDGPVYASNTNGDPLFTFTTSGQVLNNLNGNIFDSSGNYIDQQIYGIWGGSGAQALGMAADLSTPTMTALSYVFLAETSFILPTLAPATVELGVGTTIAEATSSTDAAAELMTVTHATDVNGAAAIGDNGFLHPNSFVTTDNLSGMSQNQIENFLEIDPGRGAYTTTFQTPASNLGPAVNGPLTSGGATQFQVINSTQVGTFVPTP